MRLSLALLAGSLFWPAIAVGQQTIINVPSVDQTPRGRWFALHESQVRTTDPKPYWVATTFVTYGLTDRIELAATSYTNGWPSKPYQAGAVGWKGAWPVLRDVAPRADLKVGAGQMYVASYTGRGVGVWSYGQVAGRIPGLRTRLMAGISDGPTPLFGRETTHVIASFEQPLPAHFGLLAEWWSGTHEFADFVPGVNWHWGTNVVIVGWKFSNVPGTDLDGLIIEVGRTF